MSDDRQTLADYRLSFLEEQVKQLERSNKELREALEDLGVTPEEARAGVERSRANKKDAARYRWLREKRNVLLLTGFFGNGCINRTIEEVDAAIDAALSAADAKGEKG